MPSWESLDRRIEGGVALPGSPAYSAAPRPFNARFHDLRPSAIVSCASPEDVSEAIVFARRHGLGVDDVDARGSPQAARDVRRGRRHRHP